MNILLLSAEIYPFAKTGGLADMVASLLYEWEKLGHNPIAIMPKYRFIDVYKYGFQPTDLVLYVPISHWIEYTRLWIGYLPESKVPVYLLENNDYFNRNGIYGDPEEYSDNDRRFIFFSRAVFETAKALNFTPDIIHAHDFHAAFSMAFLKSQYKFDSRFSACKGIYTIHNLAYQGWFNPSRAMDFSTFGLGQYYPGSWFEHLGTVNAMKTGIMFADKITTVSPTYASEIRYPYFSEGMQDVLNFRAGDLIGVLNGVNYNDWKPETDKNIYIKYSKKNLEQKKENKHKFLKEFGLNGTEDLEKPLVGIVTRLTEQKGIDLIINKLEWFLSNDIFRFALLGSGEKQYEDYFRYIAWKYPGKAFITIGYDNKLSHKIIACSDFLTLPSRYEPCGLTQMYALKYGTIPIVRQVGGLADSVKEYNYDSKEGTGFLFYQYNADDYAYCISRAMNIYKNEIHWNKIRQNAMQQDFSSRKTASEYIKIFGWAKGKA